MLDRFPALLLLLPLEQSGTIEETNFRARLRRAAVVYNLFGLSSVGYLEDPAAAAAAPHNSDKAKYASELFQVATRTELQACLDLWASSVEADVLTHLVEQAVSDFARGADTTHLIFDNPSYFDLEVLRSGKQPPLPILFYREELLVVKQGRRGRKLTRVCASLISVYSPQHALFVISSRRCFGKAHLRCCKDGIRPTPTRCDTESYHGLAEEQWHRYLVEKEE